jgi:hypothetical protein
MKRYALITLALMTAGMLLCIGVQPAAAVKLSMTPSAQTVTLGSPASLDVWADLEGALMGGYAFDLTYNNVILSMGSVQFAGALGSSVSVDDGSVPGALFLAETSLEPPDSLIPILAGPGPIRLLTLAFNTVGAGSTTLDFANVMLSDAFGNELGFSSEGATITAESTRTPVPEPSTFLLIGAGFIGLTLWRLVMRRFGVFLLSLFLFLSLAGAGGQAVAALLCDANGDGTVDKQDITLIMAMRNVPVTGTNAHLNLNGDGYVNILDSRICALRCTYSGCVSNSPPVANAGQDQTAVVGSAVTLNGGASSDPNGDAITYGWSFVSRPPASTATLSDIAAVNPSFTVDRPGDYVVQLIVNDGRADSAADTVTVSTLNSKPVANAGSDKTAYVTQTVELDGSLSSDVDGDPLSYAWSLTTLPPGSVASLADPAAVKTTIVVDKPGTYEATLVVGDGTAVSSPDPVIVSTMNSRPVANPAVTNLPIVVGKTVQLDGSGSSDVDGNSLTYRWSLTTVPLGSGAALSSATAVNPMFTADRPGSYVAQLIVNDATVDSYPRTVTVTTDNSKPTANPGLPQTVHQGSMVDLSGAASSDPDGEPLSYNWSFTSVPTGSTTMLVNPTSVNPAFLADKEGDYVVQLIVNDTALNSDPATVTITTRNSRPVANAGRDQNLYSGSSVTLDGSGSSDADSDPLTFVWSLTTRPDGSSATLSSTTAVNPEFTADLPGVYVVQLIAQDGFVNSDPDTVTITATLLDTVAPVVTITSVTPSVSPTNQTTMVLTWTVSEGTEVVTLDGVVIPQRSGDMLSGLTNGPHTLEVTATDVAGNSGIASYSWSVDTVPPEATYIAVTTTSVTATISWTTNEAATTKLNWGIGSDTSRTVPEDNVFVTSHSIKLTGLPSNTTFSYIVGGRDRAGNDFASPKLTSKTKY